MVEKLLGYLVQYGLPGKIGKVLVLILFLGLPGPSLANATLKIAALGDSLTQGYGLPAPDGLVPQLENWLQAHGESVSILNAGVSGDTTAGGLARVGWTLTADVGALMVELGGNDILRGIAPELARRNLDGILRAARDKRIPVLLIGLTAPGNYGADYKAGFDSIYPALAQKYDTLLFPDYLAPLTKSGPRATVLMRYFQADGIHPNAAGVKVIVKRLGPAVQALIARASGSAPNRP